MHVRTISCLKQAMFMWTATHLELDSVEMVLDRTECGSTYKNILKECKWSVQS